MMSLYPAPCLRLLRVAVIIIVVIIVVGVVALRYNESAVRTTACA